ncbi:MAG: PKD domain-containing protein, partial [Bacteroidota bacterium]
GGEGKGWVKKFEYEANRFNNQKIYSAERINGGAELARYSIGGGLRIKSIRYQFNEVERVPYKQTDFIYEEEDGTTSGVLLSPVNYVRKHDVRGPDLRTVYTMHGDPVGKVVFAPLVGYRRVKTVNRRFVYNNTNGNYEVVPNDSDGEVIREFHCQEPGKVHAEDHPGFEALKGWLPSFDLPMNGRLKRKITRARNGSFISENTYEYEVAAFESYNSVATENMTWYEDCDSELPDIGRFYHRVGYYPLDTWRILPIGETSSIYDDINRPFTTRISRSYTSKGLLRSSTTYQSDGNELTTLYRYPFDPDAMFTNPSLSPEAAETKSKMANTAHHWERNVLEVQSFRNARLTKRSRIDYGSNYLLNSDGTPQPNLYFYPKTTWSAVGNTPLRKGFEVSVIDPHTGAVLESGSGRASASVSTRLFSYNNSRLVASLPRSTFQSATAALGTSYDTFKNYTDETQISQKLASLRSHLADDVPVTTQLYDLRYGIKEVIPPGGEKQTFEFDESGRLRVTRDEDGNITQRNRYNYGGRKRLSTAFSVSGQLDVLGTPITFGWLGTDQEFVRDLSFHWDFGDGTTVVSGPTVQHTYQTPGDYEVSLSIRSQHTSFYGPTTKKSIGIAILETSICISDGPFLINAFNDEIIAKGNCAPATTNAVNPTFTATTTKGCPPYTYKWFHKVDGGDWVEDTQISSSSASYTFQMPSFPISWDGYPLTSRTVHQVRCEVTDRCGATHRDELDCSQVYIIE